MKLSDLHWGVAKFPYFLTVGNYFSSAQTQVKCLDILLMKRYPGRSDAFPVDSAASDVDRNHDSPSGCDLKTLVVNIACASSVGYVIYRCSSGCACCWMARPDRKQFVLLVSGFWETAMAQWWMLLSFAVVVCLWGFLSLSFILFCILSRFLLFMN